MNKSCVKLIFSALFLVLSSALWAGDESVGTTSANFLKIPAHARPAGMAEAYTALSDDEAALLYNPAGLARGTRHEISATHIEWFQGIKLEHLGGVMRLGAAGAVGASLSWMQVGSLIRTERIANTPDPLANFTEIGSFNPFDMAVNVGYARRIGKKLNAGAKINVIQQAIDAEAGWGFSADLGLQYVNLFPGFDLGAMATNLGSEIKVGGTGFSQPIMVNFGALLGLWNRKVNITTDVEVPMDNKLEFAAGLEWLIANTVAIRGGWRGGFAEQLNFGAGLRIAMFRLDYAYSPFSELGSTHRMTATYVWGLPDMFLKRREKLVAPLGYKQYLETTLLPDLTNADQIGSWTLDLVDAAGHVAKTWTGSGPPPAEISWDGKDSLGLVLPDQMVKGRIKVAYTGGGDASASSEEIEMDSTPPNVQIDINPKVVKPDGSGAVLIPATISLAASDKNNISQWKLVVRDQAGKLFWGTQGNGPPPPSVIWDGTDGKGGFVESGNTYIVQVYAKDGPGNLGKSEPVAQIILLKEIKLQISSDALFDPGKADVKISAYHQLKDVVALIRKHKGEGEMVEIEGHTDNEPVVHSVYGDNTTLSMARAKAVIKFMVDLLGMEEGVLVPRGYGDTRPIATNDTTEGRLANRRVEVRIKLTEYR